MAELQGGEIEEVRLLKNMTWLFLKPIFFFFFRFHEIQIHLFTL